MLLSINDFSYQARDLRLTCNRQSPGERSVTLPPTMAVCIAVPEYDCIACISRNHWDSGSVSNRVRALDCGAVVVYALWSHGDGK